jgi:hypothetical protein
MEVFFFLKALRCNSVDKLQDRLDKKKDPKTGLRKFSWMLWHKDWKIDKQV